jgi:hypothetical protein
MLGGLNPQAEIVKRDFLTAHHTQIVELEQGSLSGHGFQVYVILNGGKAAARDSNFDEVN